MKHRICILLAVLLLWPVSLLAATRAWLEQPQVTLGQAVTLNVDGLDHALRDQSTLGVLPVAGWNGLLFGHVGFLSGWSFVGRGS